ncbi:hypothetical protein KP509_36G035000 [Ceratopteris richardii]|uniref:Uncharacterized protein n=1 Tax=Ceratopteris richardii TaxID=49495 RepID=A0A8T2QC05_CERRI|nr:hypothetical protein KP509_36G035000 [Ceratopteris richardii]KAH7281197.1 hypothetical protein KP509_36G035000 [Ceratopteris richardii]
MMITTLNKIRQIISFLVKARGCAFSTSHRRSLSGTFFSYSQIRAFGSIAPSPSDYGASQVEGTERSVWFAKHAVSLSNTIVWLSQKWRWLELEIREYAMCRRILVGVMIRLESRTIQM